MLRRNRPGIRASPEQLRPASLREYQRLPRNPHGEVVDENPQSMGFISLGDDLQFGDFESEGYSPSVGATPPATPMDQSQLETEMFPPESVPSEEQPMGKMRSAKLNLHHMRYRFLNGMLMPKIHFVHLAKISFHLIPMLGSGKLRYPLNHLCAEEATNPNHETIHASFAEHVLVASSARKQKVEVQYQSLNEADKKLFDACKTEGNKGMD